MSSLDEVNKILEQGLLKTNLVYDKYQAQDFTTGVDNLNPLREIDVLDTGTLDDLSGGTLSALDELKNNLYAAYKLRIAELRDLAEKSRSEESTGANSALDLGPSYDDSTNVNITTDLLGQLDSSLSTSSSRYDLILEMLGKLDMLLDDEVMSLDDLPFDLCGDRDGTGLIPPAEHNGAAGQTGSDSSSSGSSSGSSSSSSGSSGEGSSDSSGVGGSDSDSSGTENDYSAENCLQIQLEIAGMIKMWMLIISTIQKIVSTILSIVSPIAEIASLIGGCWVNPAGLGEMVQKIASTAIAMALDALAKTVNKLIKESGLACSINELLSAGRDVMSVANGAIDAGSAMYSFVTLTDPTLVQGLTSVASEVAYTSGRFAAVASASEEDVEAYFLKQRDAFFNAATAGLTDQITDGLNSIATSTVSPYSSQLNSLSTSAQAAVAKASAIPVSPKEIHSQAAKTVAAHFQDGYESF